MKLPSVRKLSSSFSSFKQKLSRHSFAVIVALSTVISIGSTIAYAQAPQGLRICPDQNFNGPDCIPVRSVRKIPEKVESQIRANVGLEKNGELATESFTGIILGSTASEIILGGQGGGITANGTAFLGTPPKGEELAYYRPGALGNLSNATGFVATLPVSTSEYMAYVRDSIQNPLGAQPAYAQGLGFSSLRPVLDLWRLFRNLAYFFFVIIFLVIGFLIMFRSKIGGQAAVTVQQALPKIIVSLLLVTFSYAIAGLMIDLMYLLIYLMISIFARGDSINDVLTASNLTKIAFQDSFFGNIWLLMGGDVSGTIAGHVGGMVANMLSNTGWASWTSGIAGLGADIIVHLVLVIALLVNMFRVFFALLRAYVGVVFSVVFAPIQLLVGALPGQNTFGAWLRGLMENLLAFPVVIFLIFMALYFTYQPDRWGTQDQGGFAAPQLGIHQGVAGEIAMAFLQFGILAMIPQAIEIAKGLASGKLNVDVGKAVGEFWKQGRGNAVAGAVVASPLAGIGAYAGYRYASDRANKLGLEGNARRLAVLGGVIGGGGVGLNLPGTVRRVVPGILSQVGQAELNRMAHETKAGADKRRTEATTSRVQGVAGATVGDINEVVSNNPDQPATPTRGSSRNRGLT